MVCAEENPGQLGSARTEQSGQSDNLALAYGNRCVLQLERPPHIPGFEQRYGRRRRFAFPETGCTTLAHFPQFLAKHSRNNFELADLRHCLIANRLTVAHDGDAITNLMKLVEPVRNVDR